MKMLYSLRKFKAPPKNLRSENVYERKKTKHYTKYIKCQSPSHTRRILKKHCEKTRGWHNADLEVRNEGNRNLKKLAERYRKTSE